MIAKFFQRLPASFDLKPQVYRPLAGASMSGKPGPVDLPGKFTMRAQKITHSPVGGIVLILCQPLESLVFALFFRAIWDSLPDSEAPGILFA
ncbi:MAG: hypothetical protein WD872_03145 [Pirellulaceae bacterium]